MGDICNTLEVDGMTIQENGIIRDEQGTIICRLGEAIKALTSTDGKAVEAIGWAYADCCVALDEGKDPRKTEMSGVLQRATKDLNLRLY